MSIRSHIDLLLSEYRMTNPHKQAIARAHRGSRHSFNTKSKISKSMKGKQNFLGKHHNHHAKDVIGAKRGQRDPIKGKAWIVNRDGKTYRRYHAPPGFKTHKRVYESFRVFLDSSE